MYPLRGGLFCFVQHSIGKTRSETFEEVTEGYDPMVKGTSNEGIKSLLCKMIGLFPPATFQKNTAGLFLDTIFSHFQIFVTHQKNVIRRNVSFLTTRMAAVQVFDGKNLGKEWIQDWVRRAAMKPWGWWEIQKNQPANRHVLKTTSPRRFKFQLENLSIVVI